MKNFRLQIKT